MTNSNDQDVEEVREIRDAIAREFDYDIERLGKEMQAREVRSSRPVVRLPPRRVAAGGAGPGEPPVDRKSA